MQPRMHAGRLLRAVPLLALGVAAIALAAGGCTSWHLSRLTPYPIDEPLLGPDGRYELVPPSAAWVRLEENESASVDLALARQSGDAWLNASVVDGRYATPQHALETARSRAFALMTVMSHEERDLSLPSPDGPVPARMGVYCGTFDREIRARDNCFVMLAAVRAETTFVLVGQVRVKDPEPGRQDELERFVASLRLVDRVAQP